MALAGTVLLAFTHAVRAQEIDQAKAIKVKAAYLYNFAKFIEWPEDTFEEEKAPFIIGVLGNGPFGRVLDDTVRGKKIAQRPVKIRRFRTSEVADRTKLKGCHILYVCSSQRNRLKEILLEVNARPILLVSDIPEFARNGGMIGFLIEKQRIIFEINRDALAKAKLKARAKLLKLARIVNSRGRRSGRITESRGHPILTRTEE